MILSRRNREIEQAICSELRKSIRNRSLGEFQRQLEELQIFAFNLPGADWIFQDWDPKLQKRTTLMYACSKSAFAVTEYLIKSGLSINDQDTQGWTALHHACQEDASDVVNLLVQGSANLYIRNKEGQTALDLISEEGRDACMLVLHSMEAPTNQANGVISSSSFQPACGNDTLQAVFELMQRDIDVSEEAKSPLYCALKYGSVTQVADLLKAGSPVNLLPFECCERLIDSAQGHAPDTHGNCYSNAREKIQSLVRHYSPVMAAMCRNAIELFIQGNAPDIRKLVGAGQGNKLSIYQVAFRYNELHQDILVDAVERGHTDVVTFILEQGYNCDAQNSEGATALHRASVLGHNIIIERLLRKGADVKRSWNGMTALTLAAGASKLSSVILLVERGASIDGLGAEGNVTPLEYVCRLEASIELEQIVAYLVEHGANVKMGRVPPLAEAFRFSSARIVKTLLDADVPLSMVSPIIRRNLQLCAAVPHYGSFPDASMKFQLVQNQEARQGKLARAQAHTFHG
jgi:ankyrin repeat protein